MTLLSTKIDELFDWIEDNEFLQKAELVLSRYKHLFKTRVILINGY